MLGLVNLGFESKIIGFYFGAESTKQPVFSIIKVSKSKSKSKSKCKGWGNKFVFTWNICNEKKKSYY